ncbi:sigma factor-like helix-turn-helix DNA-binding protein [Streptomyces sp. NPDC090119]|uniref:sigma factor-like helix-turn-helix DNA-binding protein n=1 Tax=Streptomyces sp. NPDC090119 TaxID=3365951 RepID=UPI0038125A25
MRDRAAVRDARRAQEFGGFVAGAAARLLHTATLLTAEEPDANPRARRLLTRALAHTYAHWDHPPGEDPYDRARRHLATGFAHAPRHRSRPHGPLAALTPRERLVLVLRLYEGLATEQTATLLGLPTERVDVLCHRATATVLHPPPGPAPRGAGPVVRRLRP